MAAAKTITGRVEYYDLLSSLAQETMEIKISQLLRRDAKEAEAMARKLFREKTRRKVIAAIERKTVRQEAVINDSKRLQASLKLK